MSECKHSYWVTIEDEIDCCLDCGETVQSMLIDKLQSRVRELDKIVQGKNDEIAELKRILDWNDCKVCGSKVRNGECEKRGCYDI